MLAERGTTYLQLNAVDGAEGQARHQQDGKPMIPALVLDGDVFNFQHPAQIASLLELDVEGNQPATAVAWSTLDVLQRWVEVIRPVPFEALREPTPSRGRDIRNLTVNVFRPIGYLPRTYEDQVFEWYTGEADLQQEAFLRTTDEVVAYAEQQLVTFNSFLLDYGDDLSEHDPVVTGNRGQMSFSELLITQRFHAAFHYRQIVDHLSGAGHRDADPLPDAMVREIMLPANLY